MAGAPPPPPQDPQLDELVLEFLDRHEHGGMEVLEEICAHHPTLADGLRARVDALRHAGLLHLAQEEPMPQCVGEYHLLERLGVGGMGVVYLAEQPSLGRRVALKLVRPEHLYFPAARERFAREVQVIAGLAHPGITPIYAVGQHDGVPFFAMEYIDGRSVGEILDGLRTRTPAELSGGDLVADSVATDSWPQACLRVVRQVAAALQHAHERGVIHRDVKPSNIMLTPDGRARLVDFGLASSATADRLTRTGSTLGSTPYMAPERIDGSTTETGPATDVYALGVTLYEMLTLELPFAGPNRQALEAAVRSGVPRPPRALNAAISDELETVCAKAMDVDPSRRYPTARAFARDLTNVLEHRPIEARRAGPWVRARKWARRNPARAVAVALTALLVIGGPTVVGIQQAIAARGLGRALTLAQANSEAAQEAVEYMLEQVGDETLADIPQMEEVRRRLLERALAFYEQFAAQNADDPALERRIVRVTQRMGILLLQLGRFDESREVMARAVAAGRDLVTLEDGNANRIALARALATAVTGIVRRGEVARADPMWREASALVEELRAGDPENLELIRISAVLWRLAAGLARMRGDQAGAVQAEHQHVACRLRVAERTPGARPQEDLALAQIGLASELNRAGQFEPAATTAAEAVQRIDGLLVAEPESFRARWIAADARRVLGEARLGLGDPRGPDTTRAAIARIETLRAEFPRTHSLEVQLSRAATDLGVYLVDQGDLLAAGEAFDQALRAQQRLHEQSPESPSVLSGLATAYCNVSVVHHRLGRVEDSLGAVQRAVDYSRRSLAAAPGRAAEKEELLGYLSGTISVAEQLGDHRSLAAAARIYGQTLEPPAEGLVVAGQDLARCAALAREDSSLGEAERGAQSARYAGEAIDFLVRAHEEGQTLDALAATPDLDALHDHPQWPRLERLLESR